MRREAVLTGDADRSRASGSPGAGRGSFAISADDERRRDAGYFHARGLFIRPNSPARGRRP
jgi:hypothetical protein